MLESLPAYSFFAVFHHHLVNPGVQRGGQSAECHRATGLCLQSQCGFFHDMGQCQRCSGVELSDGREPCPQPLLEARQVVDGAFLRGAGHDGFDGRVTTPEVGPTQGPDT